MNIIPNMNDGKFTISLSNIIDEEYNIEIFNIYGNRIANYYNFDYSNKNNRISFALDVPQGIYFLTLKSRYHTETKQMIVVK